MRAGKPSSQYSGSSLTKVTAFPPLLSHRTTDSLKAPEMFIIYISVRVDSLSQNSKKGRNVY